MICKWILLFLNKLRVIRFHMSIAIVSTQLNGFKLFLSSTDNSIQH